MKGILCIRKFAYRFYNDHDNGADAEGSKGVKIMADWLKFFNASFILHSRIVWVVECIRVLCVSDAALSPFGYTHAKPYSNNFLD